MLGLSKHDRTPILLSAVSHWWHQHFSSSVRVFRANRVSGQHLKWDRIWVNFGKTCAVAAFSFWVNTVTLLQTLLIIYLAAWGRGSREYCSTDWVISGILTLATMCPTCELTAGSWISSQLQYSMMHMAHIAVESIKWVFANLKKRHIDFT